MSAQLSVNIAVVTFQPSSPGDEHMLSTSPSLDGGYSGALTPDERRKLLRYGLHSDEFEKMNLPSFLPTYLFLLRVPLDVVLECLRLRLEQRPDRDAEPSVLSIRQVRLPLIPRP